MSKYLVDEQPLIVLPSLVKICGLERAMVLQQVHFACNQPRSGRYLEDGEKWIWNTYEDWQRDYFPFWSKKNIQHHFLQLEKKGLMLSCQPDAFDRKKYYRVDQEAIKKRQDYEYYASDENDDDDFGLEEDASNEAAKPATNPANPSNPLDVAWSNPSDLPTSNALDLPSSNPLDHRTSNQLDLLPYTNNSSNNSLHITEDARAQIEEWFSFLRETRKVNILANEQDWLKVLEHCWKNDRTSLDAIALYKSLKAEKWVKNLNAKLCINQFENWAMENAPKAAVTEPVFDETPPTSETFDDPEMLELARETLRDHCKNLYLDKPLSWLACSLGRLCDVFLKEDALPLEEKELIALENLRPEHYREMKQLFFTDTVAVN